MASLLPGLPSIRLADGVIYLLLIYSKGTQDTIEPKVLKKIEEAING